MTGTLLELADTHTHEQYKEMVQSDIYDSLRSLPDDHRDIKCYRCARQERMTAANPSHGNNFVPPCLLIPAVAFVPAFDPRMQGPESAATTGVRPDTDDRLSEWKEKRARDEQQSQSTHGKITVSFTFM
jgi:hypothetical protein